MLGRTQDINAKNDTFMDFFALTVHVSLYKYKSKNVHNVHNFICCMLVSHQGFPSMQVGGTDYHYAIRLLHAREMWYTNVLLFELQSQRQHGSSGLH